MAPGVGRMCEKKKKYYSAGGDHLLRRTLCYFSKLCDVYTVSTVIFVIFSQVFCQFKNMCLHYFLLFCVLFLSTPNCKNFWPHTLVILS